MPRRVRSRSWRLFLPRQPDLAGAGADDADLAGARRTAELGGGVAAFDEHGRDPASPAARGAAGEHEARVLGRRAGLGHPPQRLAEQPADRVDVLVLELEAEQVADLVESEAGAHSVVPGLELGHL